MKAKGSDPSSEVPKKFRRQWVVRVSWVCVVVIPCVILTWLLIETQYKERFHGEKIADTGSVSIDLRLKKIEQLGGKTFFVTEMLTSAKSIKEPELLTVTVDDRASKRTNTYNLIGNYACTNQSFKGKNNEVRIHPISGSPSWFPFDNLSFDMWLTIKTKNKIAIPDPPFNKIHLYQEQEGARYVFKDTKFSPIINSAEEGATIHIKFLLARKLFSKIAFIVYASLVIIYVIITICSIKKFNNDFVMSLIGFFISIWAVREGLNSFSKGHITVVDYFFLIVPLVVLLVILAKLVINKYATVKPAHRDI